VLRGTELVSLAEAGRIRIVRRRAVVCSASPVADREIDALLKRLTDVQPPPHIDELMRHPPRGIRTAYLNRLAGQGVARRHPHPIGRDRWIIVDTDRRAEINSRVESAVTSAEPAPEDVTLAAFVLAAGLDGVVYPGLPGWPQRQRLEHLAQGVWPAFTTGGAPQPTGTSGLGSMPADGTMQGLASRSDDAVTRAAIEAAVRDVVGHVLGAALHGISVVEHQHHTGNGGGIHHGGGHHGH